MSTAATVAAAAAPAAGLPAPLAPGSVSLRLYPHALDGAEVVAEIRAQAHWSGDALLSSADPAELAEAVAQTVIAAGCDALNIRLHVPGVTPQEVRSQLAALGEVVPQVQRLLRERVPQR